METPTNVDLKHFVGTNAEFYLWKWRRVLSGEGGGAGWNFAAFFLSGFWFGYRKMYGAAAILFTVVFVETVSSKAYFVGYMGQERVPVFLDFSIALSYVLVCGAFGNRWYLAHTRRRIAEVRSSGIPEEELPTAVSERGGTDLMASAFCVVIVLFAFLLLGAWI